MEHIITGCKDCPFYNDGSQYEFAHYCNHPLSPQEITTFNSDPEIQLKSEKIGFYDKSFPITPDWCPLNKESITIIKNKI